VGFGGIEKSEDSEGYGAVVKISGKICGIEILRARVLGG
jgi:uncharacterized protein YuzE